MSDPETRRRRLEIVVERLQDQTKDRTIQESLALLEGASGLVDEELAELRRLRGSLPGWLRWMVRLTRRSGPLPPPRG